MKILGGIILGVIGLGLIIVASIRFKNIIFAQGDPYMMDYYDPNAWDIISSVLIFFAGCILAILGYGIIIF